MLLVNPGQISEIDSYAINSLNIPETTLMNRAAEAVSLLVERYFPKHGGNMPVAVILAGCGNNGGDGYAAALKICEWCRVVILDVTGRGQRSEAGRHFLALCHEKNNIDITDVSVSKDYSSLNEADIIIDAVFGTGVKLPLPSFAEELADAISRSSAIKLSIDVPLGVDADYGRVMPYTPHYDATLQLSFIKRGIVSYPAREYAGEIVYNDIGLNIETVRASLTGFSVYTDADFARSVLPPRPENSNKGTFGRLLILAGGDEYVGASLLATEAALRSGVGYVTFLGEPRQNDLLKLKFPEVIYKTRSAFSSLSYNEIDDIVNLSMSYDAVLVGPGAGNSEMLFMLVKSLLAKSGATLVIDADAINALASHGSEGLDALKGSNTDVILTPHPLELSRLLSRTVSEVQENRLLIASDFVLDYPVTLVLKGAASVIASREELYINSTGSSSLAKAGSGDVLAGVIASLCAMGRGKSTAALSALACYLHGRAGDRLSEVYSNYGVTPSDLPKAIAEEIKILEKSK